jgi:hypothetical protein
MKERITVEMENLKKQNDAIIEGRAQLAKMEQMSLIIQGRIHMLQELQKEIDDKEEATE